MRIRWKGISALSLFVVCFSAWAALPELADPYLTRVGSEWVLSGTAPFFLKFKDLRSFDDGGSYEIVRNSYHYADGTPMEGDGWSAHSWDMRPVLWSRTRPDSLWHPVRDRLPPKWVWYGGHMRPPPGTHQASWPRDNYSRDVFSFHELVPGQWISRAESVFAKRSDWPRAPGSFLGHRYGSQILQEPGQKPRIYYEEVTQVRSDGYPEQTALFSDEMLDPDHAAGRPQELVSPLHPKTGRPYPSAVREDGSALVEGPLYFRFRFQNETWEAIGFSAGSYYGRYLSCFASRKVQDGKRGSPYRVDLDDAGLDLHDAGTALRQKLEFMGGPGRPSVPVDSRGQVLHATKEGVLPVLFHAYPRVTLSETPSWAETRTVYYGKLAVRKKPDGSLRFEIAPEVRSLPREQGCPSLASTGSPSPLRCSGS